MKALRIIAAIAFAAAVVCLGSGCTVIGFGIGSYIDTRSEIVSGNPSIETLASFDPMEPVIVSTEDGAVYDGQYLGVKPGSGPEASSPVASVTAAVHNPGSGTEEAAERTRLRSGDTITVEFETGYSVPCLFRDADLQRLYYQRIGGTAVQHALLEGIAQVRLGDGQVLPPPISAHFEHTGTHAEGTLRMQLSDRMIQVPVGNITSIERKGSRTKNRLIFGLVGFVIDFIVIGSITTEIVPFGLGTRF